MASGFSDFLRNALLKDFAGVAAYAKPATIYYTLHAVPWNPAGMANEFAGGNGRVAVHGTSEPDLIGTSASHGCVRVSNADILRLARLVRPGTPVAIRA